MLITKSFILQEIKRTTAANGGTPLGWRRFATETGIRDPDWKGKHWARWSDAIKEAGFSPNELTQAYGVTDLLDQYARLAVAIGRLPAVADMRLAVRNGLKLPAWETLTRPFGGKRQLVQKLREHCSVCDEFLDVVAMCDSYVTPPQADVDELSFPDSAIGYVYLIKHGSRREYKIGRTNNALRREGEISIELPEKVQPVHMITTDDAAGIEVYWHNRFKEKRKNGEWFELNAEDVAAFKRRRFM